MIKISIEFNNDNKLTFVAKGNIDEELNINDEIKTKINKLIEKSDTSNVLTRLNSKFDTEMYKAIPIAFENAVNKEYKEEYEDKK